ncbi:B12-binding domain-containing radical SAM protein [Paenibacillus tengchongensis]|uniref:B12-binding domain-containing radical SAM protein n=1 Tax=Paenibacillus tengchongensis TaxID=2608684 RepID=UPI00124EFA7A|nr:radical SAM protein [Paenibacillus tengchongensis]
MEGEFDVLYIHPTKSLFNTEYSIMPLGIVALLNMLIKAGYRVRGINLGVENALTPNYSLIDELKQTHYKLLLVDLHWYEHSYGATSVAELSKSVHPHVPVIIGGLTSTIYCEEIITNYQCIDYVIRGDSEKPLRMLVDHLIRNQYHLNEIPNIGYRLKGKAIVKDITYVCLESGDFDYISCDFMKNKRFTYFTTEAGLDLRFKKYPILLARGCNRNCSYCCGSSKNGMDLFGINGMRVRPPEEVVNDIERLSKMKVNTICCSHDFSLFPSHYYEEIFSLIRNKRINIGLNAYCCRAPSESFVKEMIKTFTLDYSQISISLISGDEHVRRQNGIYTTNSHIHQLFEFLSESNVRTHIFYSFNAYGDDYLSFQQSLKQIESAIELFPSQQLSVSMGVYVLDPLAPVRSLPYEINSELNTFQDYVDYCKNGSCDYFIGYTDNLSKEIKDKVELYNCFKSNLEQYLSKHSKSYQIR